MQGQAAGILGKLPHSLRGPGEGSPCQLEGVGFLAVVAEMQLEGSKYGIAYTDGTEKITQLNRSLENNLLEQAD